MNNIYPMKYIPLLIIFSFIFTSCEKRKENPILNSIFLNFQLQNNYSDIIKNSGYTFEKSRFPSNPYDKDSEESDLFGAPVKSNTFFKSKLKQGYISVLPSKGNYSITQVVEFDDPKSIYKEFKNLKTALIPFAKDTITIQRPLLGSRLIKFDHFLIKLKEEYGSAYIEIASNNGNNGIGIVYDTDKTRGDIINLYKQNKKE